MVQALEEDVSFHCCSAAWFLNELLCPALEDLNYTAHGFPVCASKKGVIVWSKAGSKCLPFQLLVRMEEERGAIMAMRRAVHMQRKALQIGTKRLRQELAKR